MRKNVKQQFALRVLSTAALMAMVSSIATAAFADTYDLNKGSVTVKDQRERHHLCDPAGQYAEGRLRPERQG